MKFTKKTLSDIPFSDGRQISYKDDNCNYLNLRVSSASKVFNYYRKLNGKTRRIKIGKFPDINIQHAREKCNEINHMILDGSFIKISPIFKVLFDKYISKHAKQHRKTYAKDIIYFNKHLKQFHLINIKNISREHILKLQSDLADQNGKYTSNRVLQMLNAIFNWGIRNSIIKDQNPVKGVKLYKEHSRERFLSHEELKNFFIALNDADINEAMRDFFKLLIFVGQRKTNMLSIKWCDIDFDNAIWTIPHELTKNGEPMKAILTPPALEVLNNRKYMRAASEYVFPAKSKTGHVEDPNKAWQKVLKQGKIENLRMHDLRRTLGSWQALQGSSMLVIGKSLGHKDSKSTEVYARMNLDPVRESVNKAVNAMVNTINSNNISINTLSEVKELKNQINSIDTDDKSEFKKKVFELFL